MPVNKDAIRGTVRGAYDLQKLRIQTGLRVVATVKRKLGQEPGERERELDADAQKLIRELRKDFDRITDAMVGRTFIGQGLIDDFSEYALVRQYVRLLATEVEQFNSLERILQGVPIYQQFFKDTRGVGPAMAGVMISEIDIHKAKYASSLWKYAGLDCGPDGKGRSRRAEHLVDVEYTDKDGKEATRKSITFNPFLKTKLVGVLSGCFLRAGDSPYKTIYDNYKHRLENHATYKDVSKGHRHNMALRYMIKQFLVDLYTKWRELEGLPIAAPYSEAKLGMKHGGDVVSLSVSTKAVVNE